MLRLSLEAARREREAAEEDLEALLQSHRQEMQAWRQHLQQVRREGWAPNPGWWHHPTCGGQENAGGPWVSPQVLRDQRRQAEERAEALEHRYRALLQEVLGDAVQLSAHNQQLREAKSHSSADATTQAP